jgi:hypothetical protein
MTMLTTLKVMPVEPMLHLWTYKDEAVSLSSDTGHHPLLLTKKKTLYPHAQERSHTTDVGVTLS